MNSNSADLMHLSSELVSLDKETKLGKAECVRVCGSKWVCVWVWDDNNFLPLRNIADKWGEWLYKKKSEQSTDI